MISILPLTVLGDSSQSQSEAAILLQGRVAKIIPEKNLVAVKPNKGKRVEVMINWNTEFIGFTKLEELKREQKIKIWYLSIKETKTAVKIEKLLTLGC
ncbi:MAG: hypothetical protein ABFS19_10060 [Thermodesulfobacteriota bacterium]